MKYGFFRQKKIFFLNGTAKPKVLIRQKEGIVGNTRLITLCNEWRASECGQQWTNDDENDVVYKQKCVITFVPYTALHHT